MKPRAHSWHVPSPGHRPAGRPDPVEQLAVPVASPEMARDDAAPPPADDAKPAATPRPKPPRPH